MNTIRKLLKDRQGTAALEYGLIASLISLTAVTAFADVGNRLANTFNTVEVAMDRHDGIPPAGPDNLGF